MGATSVPVLLRQQVDRWAETWLAAKFSRLLESRAQDPGPLPYVKPMSDGRPELQRVRQLASVIGWRGRIVEGP